MRLTKDNFVIYAASHYENNQCLSNDEFDEDLRLTSTIKRLLSRYINDETVNLNLLVNLVVTFYNCFEHKAATNLLQYKLDDREMPYMNSILEFLSLPTIPFIKPDEILKIKIEGEFK